MFLLTTVIDGVSHVVEEMRLEDAHANAIKTTTACGRIEIGSGHAHRAEDEPSTCAECIGKRWVKSRMADEMGKNIKSPTHDAKAAEQSAMSSDELVARCQKLRAERDRYREGYDKRGRQLAELRLKFQRLRSRVQALGRQDLEEDI